MIPKFDNAYLQAEIKKAASDNLLLISKIEFNELSLTGHEDLSKYRIEIKDVIIHGDIRLFNKIFGWITFENVTFKADNQSIRITSCEFGLMSFVDCVFEKIEEFLFLDSHGRVNKDSAQLTFSNCNAFTIDFQLCKNFSLGFYKNKIENKIRIGNKCHLSFVYIQNHSDIYQNDISMLEINDTQLEKLLINGPGKVGNIKLLSANIAELKLSDTSVNELFIDKDFAHRRESLTNNIEKIIIEKLNVSRIIINKTIIDSISINDCFFSKDTMFKLYNSTANNVFFKNFINIGQINLTDLKIPLEGKLVIEDSDLGKAILLNCDISECELDFSASKITDMFISGTEMPKSIIGDYNKKRLVYSQIKKIYENRGDIINSLRFYSNEMNAYKHSKGWINDFPERFNVRLNFVSTNHGESWSKGLRVLLGVSFIFYTVFCILLGYRIDLTSYGIGNLPKLISYFLDFINPIHKTEDILKALLPENVSADFLSKSRSFPKPFHVFGARIVDNIGRIFISYFIYQLIQAFRRLGKK